jgi:hypothetical protein
MNAEDSSNEFQVVPGGETVRVLGLPIRPMTRSEALRLAAWLVATADPERKQFDQMLHEVLNT